MSIKTIGLLGGTSWPSTPLYYRYINERISAALGGYHSARIILYSIDYQPIKSLYPDGWDEIPYVLKSELRQLDDMGPDCILICNNTLHKAYDALVEDQEIALEAQLIHIVVATAKKALSMNAQRVLLLGTKFTMEDGFFADRLRFFGLDVDVPNEGHRNDIQEMQSQIAAGKDCVAFKPRFQEILSSYSGFDAVVLGCTELPMVITSQETDIPIINPIEAQCDVAIDLVLSSFKKGNLGRMDAEPV
ncbi:MAG: aspartate/glutamate racemase family protein [Alphaproteobacteria bacterium]